MSFKLSTDLALANRISELACSVPDYIIGSPWAGHIPFMNILIGLSWPRLYVELGVFKGCSLHAALSAARKCKQRVQVVGIDTWIGEKHGGYYEGTPILERLDAEIKDYVPRPTLIRSTFDEALPQFEDGSIDILHIDGLHTYEAVSHDFNLWLPKLSRRGVVLFHDIEIYREDFGVWRFWREIRVQYPHFEFQHSAGLGVLLVGNEQGPYMRRLQTHWSSPDFRNLLTSFCEQIGSKYPTADMDWAVQNRQDSQTVLMDSKNRDQYLDLLVSTLANTIYEDPSMDPWHTREYDSAVREEGRDWPRTAHTMVGLARLNNLRDLTQRTLDEGVPGDYIETGVWRGGCCILMKGVLQANNSDGRKIYVADSFEGLPPPNPEKYKDPADDPHHMFKDVAVPRSAVEANFRKYNLLDDNVIFVEGFFEDTLPSLQAAPFALLRLDGDMYGSTIVALENLYPKLSRGGYIIIDDYGAVEGCRQAVTDYREAHKIDEVIHEVDWTGIWWRKS